ncbi:uncharacterized protein [Halyomorpha halys]|uniref:uncharacterized protein n=1 Tax=Halyomorpha halys TaxID=286706 RepID=UPI0034D26BA7
MVLWATLLVLHGATIAGSMPAGGTPENITIMFLSPSEVKVSWTTAVEPAEKYDVTYKPTDARVVMVVAGNSDSVTLSSLKPNTQYQVTVTAVRGGRKFKSRPVVFRTQEMPKIPQETTVQITGGPPSKILLNPGIPPPPGMTPPYIQVRGVEVGIVCLVLLVWVGAIILFFNRWGKIRMLLPYQPDYKDTQLKVPGTCQQGTSCQATGSSGLCCAQGTAERDGGVRCFGWFRAAAMRMMTNLHEGCTTGDTIAAPVGLVPINTNHHLIPGTATAGSLSSTGQSLERWRDGREDWGGRRLLMSRARINSAVYIGVEAEPLFPCGGRRTRSADQLVLPLLSVSSVSPEEKLTEQHL